MCHGTTARLCRRQDVASYSSTDEELDLPSFARLDSQGRLSPHETYLLSLLSIVLAFFFNFVLAAIRLLKKVRSDHSHNRRRSRPIRVSFPKRPGFRMSQPSLARRGGCGGREFPRTNAAPHPAPTLSKLDRIEISVKVVRHICNENLWKTEEPRLCYFHSGFPLLLRGTDRVCPESPVFRGLSLKVRERHPARVFRGSRCRASPECRV